MAPNNIQAFVPEIYSKKLALAERKMTNFLNNFCNRDWEGEIKQFGDTVRISVPDPENIVIGQGVIADTSSIYPTQRVMTINKSTNFAFKINDIEKAQSQFDIIEGSAALAMQKMQDLICLELQNEVFANAGVEEYGSTAAPIEVDPDTVYDFVVDLRVKLTAKGVLNSEGFYTYKGNAEQSKQLNPMLVVTPEIYGEFLKSRVLTHPTVAGDDILQSGERKQIAGFEITVDTMLGQVEGATDALFPYIAGTKMGITFANQFNVMETLRDLDSFADIVRGLELYGYEIIQPNSLIKGFVKKADAAGG